jgi:hypothetical protein
MPAESCEVFHLRVASCEYNSEVSTAKYTLASVFALALVSSGCHHAGIHYRLQRKGADPILFPPAKADNGSQSPTPAVELKQARGIVPDRTDCDITTSLISVHWLGTTATISLQSQTFFTEFTDRPGQIDRGMYLDPLLAIEKFHTDLIDSQSRGCLREKEGERLRRAIVENFPLPPPIAYYLQLGSYDTAGYFDLTPDFRMQITSPIYSDNTSQTPDNLLGYETADYSFVAGEAEGRMRLTLNSAVEVLGGTPVAKQSLRNQLPFSKSESYFRLVFMTDETASGRITRAILLSAVSKNEPARSSARPPVSPDKFCASLSTADVTCTVFPRNFGVSPELRVRVNHKDRFVRIGAMVEEVLTFEKTEKRAPRSLKVFRPFQGRLIPIKFDHSNEDIFRLVLLPGDEVTF